MARKHWFQGWKAPAESGVIRSVLGVADAYGLAHDSVRRHVMELPKRSDGNFETRTLTAFFEKCDAKLKQKQGGKGPRAGENATVGGEEGEDTLKGEKLRQEVRRLKRENDEREGLLVLVSEVRPLLETAVKVAVGRMRGIGRSVAVECEGRTAAEIEDIVNREIDSSLSEVAKCKV